MNWILFGIYIFCLIGFLAFIAIVLMHIGEFRRYSRYINPILRIYIVLVVLIWLFGAYKVLTDTTKSLSPETKALKVKREF